MIVARSTANCRLMLMPIDDNPAGRMASGNSREKLGHSGVAARHCTLYRRIAGYTVLKLAQLGPPDVRDLLEKRLHEVVTGTAGLYRARMNLIEPFAGAQGADLRRIRPSTAIFVSDQRANSIAYVSIR